MSESTCQGQLGVITAKGLATQRRSAKGSAGVPVVARTMSTRNVGRCNNGGGNGGVEKDGNLYNSCD